MQARVAFYGQFAFEEYKVCDGVQENNEGGGKFFEWGRVLDFAVCLRLCVVEWGGEFLGSGGEIWNCELGG